MNNLDIGKNEIFSKLTRYELIRSDNTRIFIDVHEVIAGEGEGAFIATPHLIIRQAGKEFIGKGQTVTAALNDCLEKTRNVPIDEILKADRIKNR